jgi:hypothetical protein
MANEYLKRTPTSTGNRKVWTWSGLGKKITHWSIDNGIFCLDIMMQVHLLVRFQILY